MTTDRIKEIQEKLYGLIIRYKDETIFRTINLIFVSNLIGCYRMAIKQKNKIGGKIEKRPYK